MLPRALTRMNRIRAKKRLRRNWDSMMAPSIGEITLESMPRPYPLEVDFLTPHVDIQEEADAKHVSDQGAPPIADEGERDASDRC